jgi:hypothetical protein
VLRQLAGIAARLFRFAQTCPLPTLRTFIHTIAGRTGFELKKTLTEHRNAVNRAEVAGP